jgi:hypothetical protein
LVFVFALLLLSVERSPGPVMEMETPTATPGQDEVVFRSNDSFRLGGRNVLIYSAVNATTGAIANVTGKAGGSLYWK